MNPSTWKILFLVMLFPIVSLAQTPKPGPFKVRKSDRDGDGLKNKRDRCPDQAGPSYLFGCPDSDGDGVTDSKDLCPLEAGLELLLGCPDRDADGVSDLFDECPDVPGLIDRKGCPDRDRDGVVDDLDLCPDQPGSELTFGCPDRDADGIADRDDKCPDLPGALSANGCPDSDGDGISDDLDRCPLTPGLSALLGCPEIQPEDRDFLYRSRERIRFEPESALLETDAKAYLDELANLLNRYSDFQLRISVHTDTQGPLDANQKLSELQGEACLKYLTEKGIKASRLSARGFGENKPIANNRYPEGRMKNRRVEVELVLD
ncbi:MAG: OmpA family protein [Saprospirales bacterium]|nr:OmpA family protein [Saprospirales bacterium]